MPPNNGLTHPKQYDIKDSNIELIGTSIDHRVKYASAQTEPAWNDGKVGLEPGFHIWRMEDFEVIAWPKDRIGEFYDGDSYIVLHSYKVENKLVHEIFFWLGSKTTQDEAGTAAYKTVELDEFLGGVATQHREVQVQPSEDFLALFPRMRIISGGVRSGFRHVDIARPEAITTLLRIFKPEGHMQAIVHEVEPTWQSLDENDVFILDKGEKLWVWQGKMCSPMEKAKAAQVVNDLTLAKHVDVEVLAQTDSRSGLVVSLLGAKVAHGDFRAARPLSSPKASRPKKLFRLSDASGKLSFNLVKEGPSIRSNDFDTNDVFLLDIGRAIWIWRGLRASAQEKAAWVNVAQSYIGQLQGQGSPDSHLTPLGAVVEGSESPSFFKAIAG